MAAQHVPPALSIEVPKMKDLPQKSKPWSDVKTPIDILLLTVEEYEFLACYSYLENSYKSYDVNLGHVYFGTMGESAADHEVLKVALVRCFKGSSGPAGSLITVKNAMSLLKPKVVFRIGCCMGFNREGAKLGDVLISSKLITEEFQAPVRKNIGNLILFSSDGWNPPLKDPAGGENIKVHHDSNIFSGSKDAIVSKQGSMCQSQFVHAAAEKEGEGLFAAAHDGNIDWLIVEGISHFSDDDNAPDESWKRFAAVMAASLVSNLLNDPLVFKEWPHYEDLTAKRQSESMAKKQIQDSECLEECQKRLRMIYAAKSKVKIIPWDQGSAVDIGEIYTQLSWLKDHRKPSGLTKTELQSYTEIFNYGKRILVYGRPGIGKTVFTKKAAFDWSQQNSQETIAMFDLVLLIRLRDVCNLPDVPSILKASQLLASDGLISIENLRDYVVRHQEKVLLILDGYDEYVYSTENLSPVDEIWKRNQLSGCCVIITSREMKTGELRGPSDSQFEVNGFDDERQKEFARRFLEDEDSVHKFLFYLREKNLKDLAEIPLLLLILCLLWKEKDRNGLSTERVHIFTQFVETLFDHMREKQSAGSVFMKEDYTAELYALGRLAFEALSQDCLYFPLSKLPEHELIERLTDVGLFQLSNMSSLKPEKGVYFIHKSVQEYLAASFLKEELVLNKGEKNSLFKVDSIENIFKMSEVLIFAGELSEEASREIVILLTGMAAKKDGLTEYSFDNESPTTEDLSAEQRNYLNFCTKSLFCCSAGTRKELFPTFLSSLGGVLVINRKQLNVTVTENLLKTAAPLMYIFFSDSHKYTKQDYRNLITLTQQLNALIVSCSGEMKASEFLKKYPWRSADEFFLKKECMKTYVYFSQIVKSRQNGLPFQMINALISLVEATNKTKINPGGESSEQACSTHALCRVWEIEADDVNRSEVELLSDVLPLVLAPQRIWIIGEDDAKFDSDITKKILSAINPTNKLNTLILRGLNVRSSAAGFIATIFNQSPNLVHLDLSLNPLLGEGVDAISKHLRSTPHLERLWLKEVKMTKEQVQQLTEAVMKHSSRTFLLTDYHDRDGNLLPEQEWPSESGNELEQDDNGNPDFQNEWPSEGVCNLDSSPDNELEQAPVRRSCWCCIVM